MVHVPAKFWENTSMRFQVTVRKLNVTDGQKQYLPFRAFGAAGHNKQTPPFHNKSILFKQTCEVVNIRHLIEWVAYSVPCFIRPPKQEIWCSHDKLFFGIFHSGFMSTKSLWNIPKNNLSCNRHRSLRPPFIRRALSSGKMVGLYWKGPLYLYHYLLQLTWKVDQKWN